MTDPRAAVLAEAAALRTAGRVGDALGRIEVYLKETPEDPLACRLAGLLALETDQAERGVAHLRRAVDLSETVDTLYLLAGALQRAGRPNEAAAAFERVLAREADHGRALHGLAAAQRELGDAAAAERSLRTCLERDPTFVPALYALAGLLRDRGDRDGAIAAYEEVLTREPGHDRARHLLASLRGDAADSAPRAYVESLFDDFAETFDGKLSGALGYATPERLAGLLAAAAGVASGHWTIADLGCGTGLSGLALKRLAAPPGGTLIGCDLSAGMLAKARVKGLYDGLYHEDLSTCLARFPASLDAAVAADVLVYVGALAPVYGAVARALRPGGLFAFSTEDAGPGEPPLVLRESGRFAHAPDAVRAQAESRFEILAQEATTLRRDHGVPVAGTIWVLRRGDLSTVTGA